MGKPGICSHVKLKACVHGSKLPCIGDLHCKVIGDFRFHVIRVGHPDVEGWGALYLYL